MSKTIDQNPTIADEIKFELTTTDADGNLATPYKVERVVIQQLIRNFVSGNLNQFDQTVENVTYDTYFDHASAIKVFGTDTFPAWLSTDTDNALMENTSTGEFELLWTPEFAREGDYIICWTWIPMIGDNPISAYTPFYLSGSTQVTTSIPTHHTDPDKYPTLLDRYVPELFKLKLIEDDLTPDVINRLNLAIADGFIVLEDLANQIVDLIDANAINEQMLPFLGNLFNLSLKSTDPTRWRRQIKRAVPVFKKKGTLTGLTEALDQAGITLTKYTKLWQKISPSTWQEAFIVDGDTSWELAKLALISPIDDLNFELSLRLVDEADYSDFSLDNVEFSNTDGVTTMTWIGDPLDDGDIVRIIYKYAVVDDQDVEDYIRTLPLADQRDEATVTYPPKNWNVRLVADDDDLFNILCSTRHAFHDPVVFGQIRTEFPYSENIYNMEEYNGSIRNSINPCHLGKTFLDDCSCCLSSKFNLDVQIEQLSDVRINEAKEIVREYTPFHAQLQTLNCFGAITDYIPPSVESVECLVTVNGNEDIISGQGIHTRIDADAFERDFLADSSVIVDATDTGFNNSIILYSPDVRFDRTILGINESANLLEILSGDNTGEYTVTNPEAMSVEIVDGSPDSIAFPLDTSEVSFRLSNVLYSGSATSVTQDDLYIFSDDSADLVMATNAQAGWKIVVTSGPHAGTYIISDVLPDNTFQLASWPTTTDVADLSYQLTTDADVDVGDPSSTGNVAVTRRGRVDVSTDIETDFDLKSGSWALINGTQYEIMEFSDTDQFYVEGYTDGDVGVTAFTVFDRLLDRTGFLGYRGMRLSTATDYEVNLGITNGANGSGPTLENNSVKENYMVLIESNYYQITQIDGTNIYISGPMIEWGLSGTSVDYSIIYFEKTSVTLSGQNFYLIDRRNNDVVPYIIDTGMSMAVAATAFNRKNSGQAFSPVSQSESITCEIEYR